MSLSWIFASLILWGADEPSVSKLIPPKIHPPRTSGDSEPLKDWQLTLREAIRTGLANSDVIYVVAEGKTGAGDLVIAPIKSDCVGPKLESALQALIRSIEPQYWALSQQKVELWARETAVKLCEEIAQHERADRTGRQEKKADLAEAEKCLEKCQLLRAETLSNVIKTERQLHGLLGLPTSDHRHIIPVTPPVEAKIEPDWETCLKAMTANQPDVVAQRVVIKAAEQREDSLRSLESRFMSPVPDALTEVYHKAKSQAQDTTAREKAFYQQVIHQSTHSLARFFLEVDANYKQSQIAKGLREAAQGRLESARADHEAGKAGFTIDLLLGAVTQYADAVAQEARFKSSYNVAITALSEAQGMLLNDCQVVVKEADLSRNDRWSEQRRSAMTGHTVDPEFKKAALDQPAAPDPDAGQPKPATTSIQYQISIDKGSKTIKFEGKITTSPKS